LAVRRLRCASVIFAVTSGVTSIVRSSPSSRVISLTLRSASAIATWTRTSAFSPFRLLISARISAARFFASSIFAVTSGVASSFSRSAISSLTSLRRALASLILTSISGDAVVPSRSDKSFLRSSTFLPVSPTSLPRSRSPLRAGAVTASKIARTVRSATVSHLPHRGLLAGRVERHLHEQRRRVRVVLAPLQRVLDSDGAVAAAQRNDVGVLVVGVLTLVGVAAARG